MTNTPPSLSVVCPDAASGNNSREAKGCVTHTVLPLSGFVIFVGQVRKTWQKSKVSFKNLGKKRQNLNT